MGGYGGSKGRRGYIELSYPKGLEDSQKRELHATSIEIQLALFYKSEKSVEIIMPGLAPDQEFAEIMTTLVNRDADLITKLSFFTVYKDGIPSLRALVTKE